MPKITPSQVVALIEEIFPITTSETQYTKIQLNTPSISGLQAVIELTESIPEELITLEGSDFADLMIGITGIKTEISGWSFFAENRLRNLLFVQGRGQITPLDLIHGALKKCPDAAPSPETKDLSFVEEEDLRKSLRLDLSSANRALAEGEWKAATVLAGSIIEALLLWALDKRTAAERKTAISDLRAQGILSRVPKHDDLEDKSWGLHEYCEVSAKLNLITQQTAVAVRQTKDFRNLIHPGKAARTQQQCNRGTALAALAAVEFVVEDVASFQPPKPSLPKDPS